MKKYNIAVVGATGMVGSKFLEVLTERKLHAENYFLFASAKSAGKQIDFMGKPHTVIELKEEGVEVKSKKELHQERKELSARKAELKREKYYAPKKKRTRG